MTIDYTLYANFLKEEGLSSAEIMYAVCLKKEGKAMTNAIYKFNELYDKKVIDGFPDSAINVLEMFYGKRILRMRPDTLCKKVEHLESTLTNNVNSESIKEAVEYYLK